MKKFTFLAATAMLATMNANAETYFCSPSGAGDEDGTSWENALPSEDINSMVSSAEPGDILYLLEGTYTGTQITPVQGISVIGGFAADSKGTDISGYNPWKNKTIFDANGKNGGAPFVYIKGENGENAPLTTIKGITVTGCIGQQTTKYCGTAFACDYAYVLLEDVTFDKNTSFTGAPVVANNASKFHAKHCVWTNNQNIYEYSFSSKNNVWQTVFNGRSDEKNGTTNCVLEGCVMVNNTIKDVEEAKKTACYGGGISVQDGVVNLAMVNCFTDGAGQTIKQNGGFLRTSNKCTLHFLAFNTFCNYLTDNKESKGNIISFNGLTPFYLQGNIFTTSKKCTDNDTDKANNAVFVQGWNGTSMASIISGGDNSIDGLWLSSKDDCTLFTQQATDNWLAPVSSEVFGSNTTTEKDGRYYIEPVAAYGNVNLQDALDNFNSFEMPDCFKWANIDLTVDLFGNKRAATTYRGAYDPNAGSTSGIDAVYAAANGANVTVKALGNGNFAIEGAEGMAQVYDMAGRLVASQHITDGTLSLTNAAAGIYVVRVAGASVKIAR